MLLTADYFKGSVSSGTVCDVSGGEGACRGVLGRGRIGDLGVFSGIFCGGLSDAGAGFVDAAAGDIGRAHLSSGRRGRFG